MSRKRIFGLDNTDLDISRQTNNESLDCFNEDNTELTHSSSHQSSTMLLSKVKDQLNL